MGREFVYFWNPISFCPLGLSINPFEGGAKELYPNSFVYARD